MLSDPTSLFLKLIAASGGGSSMPEWVTENPVYVAITSIAGFFAICIYFKEGPKVIREISHEISKLIKRCLVKPGKEFIFYLAKNLPSQWSMNFWQKLREHPAESTAIGVAFTRFIVILGFSAQHLFRLYCDKYVTPGEIDVWKHSWTPAALTVAGAICIFSSVFTTRKSFHLAKIIDDPRTAEKERDKARHSLFSCSLVDVVMIFFAGLWPPAIVAEVHLGYFVAIASAWQFSRLRQICFLGFSISAALLARWGLVGLFYSSGMAVSSVPMDYRWFDIFVLNVVPKLGFWFLLSVLCAVLMLTRKTSESRRRKMQQNEVFYRGLAEALPLNVFVKDENCRFIYANERMLSCLRKIPGNKYLVCDPTDDPSKRCIRGLDDSDLKMRDSVVADYQKSDLGILKGGLEHYRQLEPNFAIKNGDLRNGGDSFILTTKAPLKDLDGNCIGLVGICQESFTEEQATFYKAIIDCSPHYFFQKHKDGKFKWANEQFWLDAGRASLPDPDNVYDHQIYPSDLAKAYRRDDEKLMKMAEETPIAKKRSTIRIQREEWHQFQGGRRERVWVIKKPMIDENGIVTGVQGCFHVIESSVARREWMERAFKSMLPKIHGDVELVLKNSLKGTAFATTTVQRLDGLFYYLRHLLRAVRLVNLSDWQLEKIDSEAPDLAWRVDPIFNKKLIERLGETLQRWFPRVEFKVQSDDAVSLAKVDSGWVSVIAAVFWINAAQQIDKSRNNEILKLEKVRGKQQREKLWLKLEMEGEALCVSVNNSGAPLKTGIIHPNQLRRPTLADGTLGIGLEIVCRIESISGGIASCRTMAGDVGAVFRFVCPTADRSRQMLETTNE